MVVGIDRMFPGLTSMIILVIIPKFINAILMSDEIDTHDRK
jgi:hypothetical protein